jgi:hypothetical protein
MVGAAFIIVWITFVIKIGINFNGPVRNCQRWLFTIAIVLVIIICYLVAVSNNSNATRSFEHIISNEIEAAVSNGEV